MSSNNTGMLLFPCQQTELDSVPAGANNPDLRRDDLRFSWNTFEMGDGNEAMSDTPTTSRDGRRRRRLEEPR